MSIFLALVWWTGLAFAVTSTAYLLLAMICVAAHRAAVGPGWPEPAPVTVYKPMCGVEDGLTDALASCLAQQVTSPLQFVFGVADAADAALALAREVAARYPGVECQFVADSTAHGQNPKVANLVNMARAAPPSGIVVLSDSDTVMEPGELQASVDALSTPGVGAVTSLYRGRPGISGEKVRAFGTWLLDYWFLPRSILHARLGPLAVTYGPLTAVRGDVFAAIGGFAALADEMVDDNALGRLVREAGYDVAFSPRIAQTLVNDATVDDLFHHERRWVRVLRAMDPGGFLASVISHAGPLPLLMLVRPDLWAVAGIAAPIVLRWLLALQIARRFGKAPGMAMPGLFALWLRDMFCFATWLSACFVSHVDWRGNRIDLAGPRKDRPMTPAGEGAS